MNKILVTFCLVISSFSLFGQLDSIGVSFPENPEDLEVCNDSSYLTVQLVVFRASADNAQVRLSLPEGVVYAAGSIEILPGGTNNGLDLVENDISDLNSPVFDVEPADLNLADSLQFRILRTAFCPAIEFSDNGGIFADSVIVTHDAADISEVQSPAYALRFGSIINVYDTDDKDLIITSVPQNVCKNIEMRQGGLGSINQFIEHQVSVGSNLCNYTLIFNGDTVIPDMVVEVGPDTVYTYMIDMLNAPFGDGDSSFIGNKDQFLDNGEIILFEECFDVKSCEQDDNVNVHQSSWGCENEDGVSEVCQTTQPTSGSVAVESSAPILALSRINEEFVACLDGTTKGFVEFRIINTDQNVDAVTIINPAYWANTFDQSVNAGNSTSTTRHGSICTEGSTFQMGANGAEVPFPVDTMGKFISAGSCSDSTSFIAAVNYVIPAGDTLFVKVQQVFCCFGVCDVTDHTPLLYFNTRTIDPCNPTITRFARTNATNIGRTKSAASPVLSGPAAMNNNQTETFCFEYPTYRLIRGFDMEYIEFDVELPPGFMYVDGTEMITIGGDSTFNANMVTQNGTMDTISFRYPAFKFKGGYLSSTVKRSILFCFDAMLDCSKPGASSGTKVINVEWSHNPNPACNPECIIPMRCDPYNIVSICPEPCPEGGGIMRFSTAARSNVDLEDFDNDRRWDSNDPANPADVRLDRLCPGDTLCFTAGATMAIGDSSLNGPWTSGFFHQRMSWGSQFSPIEASGTVFIDGIGYDFEGLTGDLFSSSGEQATFAWDLTPQNLSDLGSTIPASSVYDNNDSIYIETCYRFNTDDTRFYEPCAQQSSFPAYVLGVEPMDIVNNLMLSIDDGATRYSCVFSINRVNLISTAIWIQNTSNGTVTTCGEFLVQNWIRVYRARLGANDDFDFFPNEFRPSFKMDTLYMDKKQGAVPAYLRFLQETFINGGSSSPTLSDTNLADIEETASQWFVELSSLYEDQGGPLPYYEEQLWLRLLPYWQTDCNYVPLENDEEANDWRVNIAYNNPRTGEHFNKRDLSTRTVIQPNSYSFIQSPFESQAFTKETCFGLRARNERNTLTPFTWLTIPDVDGISITKVIEDGVETVYNSEGFYELGDHPGLHREEIEICVEIEACVVTDFDVLFWWNCTGYPDSVETAFCDADTITYRITPALAQVQLQITDQPSSSDYLPLCDTFEFAVEINSAQSADLINPGIIFKPPTGLELIDVVGEYEGNSGNTEMMTLVDLMDGNFFVDATEHSGVTGDSLPGLITTVQPEPRLFQLVLRYTTNCDFSPGSRMGFEATGFSPCGDPAQGTGTTTFSNALNIEGAESYFTAIDVQADTIEGCSLGATVQVNYLILGDSTTNTDTTVLTLPPGVSFDTSSVMCLTDSCVSLVADTTDLDGNRIVKFKVPSGVQSFQEIAFSFEIGTDNSTECSDSIAYQIQQTVTIPALQCGMMTCTERAVVITGDFRGGLAVKKSIVSFDTLIVCTQDGEYLIGGGIIIDSVGLTVDDSLVINITCASDSTMLIDSIIINGPVTAGDTVEFEHSIDAVCAEGEAIVFSLPADENCICSDLEAMIIPELEINVEAGSSPPICGEKFVDLQAVGASITGGVETGTWTTTGDGIFEDVDTYPESLRYIPGDMDKTNGTVTLRLTSDDPEGPCISQFDDLIVRILNVDCGTFPWDGN